MSSRTNARREVDGIARRRVSAVTPADGLLHPLALLAIGTLIVNDQVLKAAWPGVLTGKLSDVAGLVVAPLAIQAVWELVSWGRGRWTGPSGCVLAVAIALVAIAFSAIQVWEPAVDLYRIALGAVQWPFHAVIALLQGAVPPAATPVSATPDLADLIALPALGISWWIGRGRSRRYRRELGVAER